MLPAGVPRAFVTCTIPKDFGWTPALLHPAPRRATTTRPPRRRIPAPTSRRRGGRHPKGRSAAEEARSALAAPAAAATPRPPRSPEREMNRFLAVSPEGRLVAYQTILGSASRLRIVAMHSGGMMDLGIYRSMCPTGLGFVRRTLDSRARQWRVERNRNHSWQADRSDREGRRRSDFGM